MNFEQTIEWVGKATDAAGVAVIAVGALFLTARFLYRLQRGMLVPDAYTLFRQGLGRAILLGLEFLVAGDIIRTVGVAPTFTSVGVLAIIVLIRTFLSFELELEIDGRWPWQRRSVPPSPAPEPGRIDRA
jgi:uncharacterized membrane protein